MNYGLSENDAHSQRKIHDTPFKAVHLVFIYNIQLGKTFQAKSSHVVCPILVE